MGTCPGDAWHHIYVYMTKLQRVTKILMMLHQAMIMQKMSQKVRRTDDVPSPLFYGRKTTDPSKVKTSKKRRPIRVKPLETSMDDPPADENVTGTMKGHTFDPTDVRVYEFFIQGTPNPKDLEGVEEDQLLDIQRTIQEKLNERDKERERNITKRMKQYKQKYDFINKALLESVAQITEMTKSDHPAAAARVK